MEEIHRPMAVRGSFNGSFGLFANFRGVIWEFWEFLCLTLGVFRATPRLSRSKPYSDGHEQEPFHPSIY